MPRTIVLESISEEGSAEITRLDSGSVTIGRDTENSIAIDSVAVSRRHAAIINSGSQWVFRDLGSTNGSWVNGVQANPGQICLLRDGDTLQLSDFPIAISSAPGSETERVPCSLLVFSTDVFQGEHVLSSENDLFRAGGPGAQITVDGEDPNNIQFEICNVGGRVELKIGVTSFSVIVNGMATKGDTQLRDRDEITFGLYKIVVNDALTAQVMERPVMEVPQQSPSLVQQIPSQSEIPGARSYEDNWEAESSRRRGEGGQNFVFGSSPGMDDPTGTMSYRQDEFQAKAGFGGMSMSQRLSSYNQPQQQNYQSSDVSDSLFAVIGILILLAIAGVVFFIVSYL